MISTIKILFGKDGFRKNHLLKKMKLTGFVNNIIDNSVLLPKGEFIEIKLPEEITNKKFQVKKWKCKIGDIVDYGDILVVLENDKTSLEFENYNLGEVVYINNSLQTIKSNVTVLKLKGI